MFLRQAPAAADHAVVCTLTQPPHIIWDRSRAEVENEDPIALAVETWNQCGEWARDESKEIRFRVTWQVEERILAAHQWRQGDSGLQRLDGSIESMRSQDQRHIEMLMRQGYDTVQLSQDSWKQLIEMQRKEIERKDTRIAELEKRIADLANADTEMQLAQQGEMIERRTRTMDIVEKQLIPLLLKDAPAIGKALMKIFATDGAPVHDPKDNSSKSNPDSGTAEQT